MWRALRWASDNLSAIFVVGLAVSVASFVDSLQMGRDAIDFVIQQLAKIKGLEDVAAFVAAVVHGLLEWWRGVVTTLVNLLGISIPQWMHQPVSVTFFIVSRAINQGIRVFSNTEADYALMGPSGKQQKDDSDEELGFSPFLVAALNRVRAWRAAANGLSQSFGILFVMLIMIFVDKAYVGTIDSADLEVLAYLFVMAGLMLLFYVVSDRAFLAFLRLRDAASELDQINMRDQLIRREQEIYRRVAR